jgi:hypothetical protein
MYTKLVGIMAGRGWAVWSPDGFSNRCHSSMDGSSWGGGGRAEECELGLINLANTDLVIALTGIQTDDDGRE